MKPYSAASTSQSGLRAAQILSHGECTCLTVQGLFMGDSVVAAQPDHPEAKASLVAGAQGNSVT